MFFVLECKGTICFLLFNTSSVYKGKCLLASILEALGKNGNWILKMINEIKL